MNAPGSVDIPGIEVVAPDYSRSYFKVPREIQAALVRDHIAWAVFGVILSRVAFEPGVRTIGTHRKYLATGQAVIGEPDLATTLGTTRAAVRGALKRLHRAGFIASVRTNAGTTVTVVGYAETYAATGDRSPTDSPATNQRTNHGQTVDEAAAAPATSPLSRSEIRDPKRRNGETGRRESAALSPLVERVVAVFDKLWCDETGNPPFPPDEHEIRLIAKRLDAWGYDDVEKLLRRAFRPGFIEPEGKPRTIARVLGFPNDYAVSDFELMALEQRGA